MNTFSILFFHWLYLTIRLRYITIFMILEIAKSRGGGYLNGSIDFDEVHVFIDIS